MNDDEREGMRIVRGTGKRAKISTRPSRLIQAAPGSIRLVAVRIGAHLAGPRGDYDFTLARFYDLVADNELFQCGDLCVARSNLVPIYEVEES